MGTYKNNSWEYMTEGLRAEGHTPIYKMHKYFARRPQNVFAALIDNYSKEGDIILDPFCGGGVTAVEGIAKNRRVIANDINPLATFVTKCEVANVELKDYLDPMEKILERVRRFAIPLFSTQNRDSGETLPVRWYEHAYTVCCPECGCETALSSDNKKLENGKQINGWYVCEKCGADIQAVSTQHVSSRLLTVTYKVTTRETQRTVEPNDYDYEAQNKAETLYHEKIETGEWEIPRIDIPLNWDRQQEDCLIRKGFREFKDFFTHRNLTVMAYFFRCVKEYKDIVPKDVYDLLLLTFSATLRYTNNMTISTSMWQDGRPVAWAKHAYWMSYQYVEVNPIEYIEKRMTAIKSALVFQKEKFDKKPCIVEDYFDLVQTDNAYLQLNQDSSHLPIPDASVDLVLTDPPYGGNVQYGELSAFWLTWIYEELGVSKEYITELNGEILVHRKNKVNAKTHQTYYEGLKRVYSECYRILKPGQPLVFTFNSKDAKVWLAVLKAVLDSGFVLEPEGIIYQSPIEIYKNTAHTMAAGTVHGDFIYTFVKPKELPEKENEIAADQISTVIVERIPEVIRMELNGGKEATISELYISVLRVLIPLMAKMALSKDSYEYIKKLVNGKMIEDAIKSNCVLTSNNMWKLGDQNV